MRSRYKIIQEGIYFITSTIIEWLPVFTSEKYFQIILTMSHFKNYWAHETLEILKMQKTPLYISCFFVIFVGE